MANVYDTLDLIIIDLIQARWAKKEDVFVFASGILRGKLIKINYSESVIPALTFGVARGEYRPCVVLSYIPGPRNRDKVQDPSKYNFTRNVIHYHVPVSVASDALFLQKIGEGRWMLNVNTAVKA